MARGEIAVGISSTYRKYHPGRRRLAPITLLPKRDTTAYICDEYKVPLASSKDGKVHIEYLIGWTDLRAGMISIDAEHVRDYVSAQEYEEWNIKKAAERDEELRKEEEAENVKLVKDMEKAQREAKKKESGIVLRNGTLRIPGQSEPSLSASKMTTQKPRSPSTDDENQTEEVYEVKRLEGTKIYDTEAGPQRYFLVRWKGSWPKGQNPTWEPESYIPKDMARRFLMKQGAALGMDGVTNSPDDPAHSPWEKSKKWSSVSEAFAGENDGPELEGGDSGNSAHNNQPSSGRSYDADELLLVTDEFSPAKKPALSWDMLMGRKFGEST
ncbi:hypothetical protein ACHAQA_002290 [Verticillium albo-atrum]